MARIRLDIAYVGTDFAGWQIQSFNQGKMPRTVQAELEAALKALLEEEVRVHAAGRTDSGVHADIQTVHFDVPDKALSINWQQALHRKLPQDISIISAEQVSDDFHARFDCKGRVYTYCLWQNLKFTPPRLRSFAWSTGELDLERMDTAARFLEGQHDFAGFQNSGSDPSDTIRVISSISRYFLPLPGQTEAREPFFYLAWNFAGDGFLKQMVRNLMGFLVYVGLGKLEPEDALYILQHKSRTILDFPTAPAWGLTLTKLLY